MLFELEFLQAFEEAFRVKIKRRGFTMNSKLRKNSLIVLIVALVLSMIAGLSLGFIGSTPADAYTTTIRYKDGVAYYNIDHWTAQGNRVAGETSGKWYFGYGDISTGSATWHVAENSSSKTFIQNNDSEDLAHGYWSGYNLTTRLYSTANTQSMFKWEAEADGYVKLSGIMGKYMVNDASAVELPWMDVNWGYFSWVDGDSYTVSIWKANADSSSNVMCIDSKTYAEAYRYDVNPTGSKIAVKKGDAIYICLKCNSLGEGHDEWSTNTLTLLSSEFTANTNTTAYAGDDIIDITKAGNTVVKMQAQGSRSYGETSGKWYYRSANISASTGYTINETLTYNATDDPNDSHRFLSSYSNMICWGDSVSCNTRYATVYEWNAEASGSVRLGGVIAKGYSDKGGLLGLTNSGIKPYTFSSGSNGTGYNWHDGDSYTVGVYKVSGETVTVISERTFTSEYAYLIPSDSIAVSAGDKVVVALKANVTVEGDWGTSHLMRVDAKFTQDLKLGMSITKNMVLQQNKNVKIWGTGTPGRTVTVSIDSQVKTATIDSNGDWSVQLDPMAATFTGKTMTITDGYTTKELTGIVVGEVWMTSGQSNMAYTLLELLRDRGYDTSNMSNEDIYAVKGLEGLSDYADCFSKIRVFTPGYADKTSPDKNGTDAYWVNEQYGWGVGGDIKGFWGHTYYGVCFALRLQQKLGVPVGIIYVAVGGSSIEQWLSSETVSANDYTMYYGGNTGKAISGLYNGMMYPVRNATISGFMWYQGCADSQHGTNNTNPNMADDWGEKMKGFVAQVRKDFGANLPFISQSLVQNHAWSPVYYIRNVNWNLQNSISNFYAVNGIAYGYANERSLGVTLPTDTSNDIHPIDKLGPSRDAANIALNYVYGKTDCMGTAAYPTKVYRSGTNVIIDYGAMEKDSSNYLVLTSGTTVNNLRVCESGTWKDCTTATLSENKIIIPNASNITHVAYAQSSIMMDNASSDSRCDNTSYNSDQSVNLFSANGVAAAPYSGIVVQSTNYQTGVSILVKQDFTMQYTFIVKQGYSNPTVTFSYNGRSATVSATKNSDGLTYTASFSGIAPQDMNDGVTVTKITATDTLGRSVDLSLNWAKATDFSVQDYLVALKKQDSSDTTQKLIVNMLNYGAAAQTYLGHDTANLANSVLTSTEKSSYAIAYNASTVTASAVRSASGEASTLAAFKTAQAWFDNTNGMKIYFFVDDSIKANASLQITNTAGFSKTVTSSEFVAEPLFGEKIYSYKLENISITNYTTAYTFQLKNGSNAEGKALNYNMYGYINSIVNGNKNANYVSLVKALYSYSQAVLALN